MIIEKASGSETNDLHLQMKVTVTEEFPGCDFKMSGNA